MGGKPRRKPVATEPDSGPVERLEAALGSQVETVIDFAAIEKIVTTTKALRVAALGGETPTSLDVAIQLIASAGILAPNYGAALELARVVYSVMDHAENCERCNSSSPEVPPGETVH